MNQAIFESPSSIKDDQDSGKNAALTDKINSLRQNAFTLLQEVKQLSSLSYADISRGIDLYKETCRFEIRLIQKALEETDGNQVRAARLLGLNNTTLNAKIKRYGIDPRGSVGDAVGFDSSPGEAA
jgi:transcriptional regulator with GAF, ATPase, and Fis domain